MQSKILPYLTLASILFITGCGTTPTTDTTTADIAVESLLAPQTAATDTTQPATDQTVVTKTPASTTPTLNTNNPPMEYNASKHYTAILHTSKGDIEIAFNFGQTPNTVKNFITLAQKNFYDGTIFHRVIKGFMIQGGDPEGNGTGGPGYKFDDEPFTSEYTRGTVAMANSGPNTNGSQFFIMHADYALPKNYTIFGHVTKGLEVVDAIVNSAVTTGGSGEPSKPLDPTVVKSVDVKEQ